MKEKVKAWLLLAGIPFGTWALFGSGYSTEDLTKQETIPYSTVTKYDNTLREGITKVTQEGKDGSKSVTYEVTSRFGDETNRRKKSEKVEKEPTSKIVVIGTKQFFKCSNGVEYEAESARDECEHKISWTKQRDKALAECRADSSKFNCWYDAYPGTTLHWSYYVKSAPTYRTPSYGNGTRYGAICRDGTRSNATGRGACSHHGGVSMWLTY